MQTLEELRPKLDPKIFYCKWRNSLQQCEDIFTPTLTTDGLCMTFNNLQAKEIYRNPRAYSILSEHSHTADKWTLEEGYASDEARFPRRAINSGAHGGLVVVLPLYKEDTDYKCRNGVQGFKLTFHTPGEVAQVSKQYYRIPMDHYMDIRVKPNLVTSSRALRSYAPER